MIDEERIRDISRSPAIVKIKYVHHQNHTYAVYCWADLAEKNMFHRQGWRQLLKMCNQNIRRKPFSRNNCKRKMLIKHGKQINLKRNIHPFSPRRVRALCCGIKNVCWNVHTWALEVHFRRRNLFYVWYLANNNNIIDEPSLVWKNKIKKNYVALL
jgi:hypothetical protein